MASQSYCSNHVSGKDCAKGNWAVFKITIFLKELLRSLASGLCLCFIQVFTSDRPLPFVIACVYIVYCVRLLDDRF